MVALSPNSGLNDFRFFYITVGNPVLYAIETISVTRGRKHFLQHMKFVLFSKSGSEKREVF
jgi:hypothetical protein